MYITSTRGRQDNFRLQAGFTPVNGVILYDQVTIGHVKRGDFFNCVVSNVVISTENLTW